MLLAVGTVDLICYNFGQQHAVNSVHVPNKSASFYYLSFKIFNPTKGMSKFYNFAFGCRCTGTEKIRRKLRNVKNLRWKWFLIIFLFIAKYHCDVYFPISIHIKRTTNSNRFWLKEFIHLQSFLEKICHQSPSSSFRQHQLELLYT